jgi:purine-binding chemotaxis protein CheW
LTANQWLSFKLVSQTYVQSVDRIKEIITYKSPVPVPGSPSCAEGILNVRGNVVTILSGRLLFGHNEPEKTEARRIIIFQLGADQVGVSVDSVIDIITFQSDNAQWTKQESQLKIVTGTIQLDEQLYILTDLSNFDISDEDK